MMAISTPCTWRVTAARAGGLSHSRCASSRTRDADSARERGAASAGASPCRPGSKGRRVVRMRRAPAPPVLRSKRGGAAARGCASSGVNGRSAGVLPDSMEGGGDQQALLRQNRRARGKRGRQECPHDERPDCLLRFLLPPGGHAGDVHVPRVPADDLPHVRCRAALRTRRVHPPAGALPGQDACTRKGNGAGALGGRPRTSMAG